MTQAPTGTGMAAGVPVANLDNPTVQNPPMQPAQPAANAVAQQVQTPPTQQTLPAAAAQPAAVPVAQPAPAQAISPDFPIDHNGQQVKVQDALAAYDLAQDLRLNDNAMKEFLTTVSMAYRGDQGALEKLQAINEQLQPPVVQPVAAAVQPGTQPGAAPVAQPAAAAGTPGMPQTQPPVAGGEASAPIIRGVREVIEQVVKPVVDRMGRYDTYFDGMDAQTELTQLTTFIEGKKTEYPNLAANKAGAERIRSNWRSAVEAAKASKGARPDQNDLVRMIQTEEAYLAASAPAPQNGPNVEVVRMDEPAQRIPGRAVPGRPAPGPLDGVQGIVRPQAVGVAQTTPPAGGVAPGVEPATPQPMNQASLGVDLQSQFREMGAQR
jgi:hypothetical protein